MWLEGTKYIFIDIKNGKVILEYKISGRKPKGRRYWTIPPKTREITRVIKNGKFKLDGKVYHTNILKR